MNLRLSKKAFLNAISVGGSVAGRSKVLPVLECVKCSLYNGRLSVCSYDQETMVSKCIDAIEKDVESGSFCVNMRDLRSVVSSIDDDAIDLFADTGTLYIAHSKGRIELPCYSGDDFPSPVEEDGGCSFSVPSQCLYEILGSAVPFMCVDNIKAVLCGISVSAVGDLVEFASTDGRLLFVDSIRVNADNDSCSAIIPSGGVQSIMNLINGTEEVSVRVGTHNISFITDDGFVVCRMVEGRFPNYNNVIPKSSSCTAEVDKTDFLSSVKRVDIASNSSSKLIRLNFDGISVKVSAEDFDLCKKAHDMCLCSYAGEPVEIGMSAKNLISALSAVRAQNAVMLLTDGTRPMVIKDSLNERRTIMVMPMRLSE